MGNISRWKEVEYSKREINDAGNIIRDMNASASEKAEATKIVDNWRMSHAYPMHVIYMHLRRMAQGENVLVVERLKRMSSIIAKLNREPGMELWRMHDLGGCRVIVPRIEDVYEYSGKYIKSKVRHELKKQYDYIENPKISGYRSLHLRYKFYSDKKETYNRNMLIEIQFRTQLQHYWATAVETMGIFTQQALKSGVGNEEVLLFFKYVSSLFAIEEKCNPVPGTPHNRKHLIQEIKRLNAKNHVLEVLSALRVTVERNKKRDINGYYLLMLDYINRKIRVWYYKPHQLDDANNQYLMIEQRKDDLLGENVIDVVLVRASSFKDLKAAYPNYFADIGSFIKKVESLIKR